MMKASILFYLGQCSIATNDQNRINVFLIDDVHVLLGLAFILSLQTESFITL